MKILFQDEARLGRMVRIRRCWAPTPMRPVSPVDGASSHVSKELKIPENIRLHRLPPYSPELNPVEHIWDEIREKSFPTRVFSEMKAVIAQLTNELPALASDVIRVKGITAWPSIVRLNLKDKKI